MYLSELHRFAALRMTGLTWIVEWADLLDTTGESRKIGLAQKPAHLSPLNVIIVTCGRGPCLHFPGAGRSRARERCQGGRRSDAALVRHDSPCDCLAEARCYVAVRPG